ncbi:MAG: sigma-70 family RNA polymerase sigma factor [Lysobacterales bacterium]
MNRLISRCDSRMNKGPADLSDDDVRSLLDRLAGRDERALRELHERFARRIYLFAVSRLRDEDAAQTVMNDTLFECWKHPDRFRGESRFSTWLLGIAKYKVLTSFRSRGIEHEDIDDYAEVIADPSAGVVETLEDRERQQLLKDCIDALNDAQRECVQLVYLEGLALAEVAAVQKVPEGTVKTRLFHGRKNLRSCVEQRGGD